MQTFLPYPSFKDSARVLDNKRLGKQRVEAKQILKVNHKLYVIHNEVTGLLLSRYEDWEGNDFWSEWCVTDFHGLCVWLSYDAAVRDLAVMKGDVRRTSNFCIDREHIDNYRVKLLELVPGKE